MTEAEADEDLDSWREAMASITPVRVWDWLDRPVRYVLGGAAILVLEIFNSHRAEYFLQGWQYAIGASLVIVWALVLAILGRRASRLCELGVSQNYVRWQTAGTASVCILATVIGTISASVFVAGLGFFALWSMRTRPRLPFRQNSSEFSVSLTAIVARASLVEGVVVIALPVLCAVLALVLAYGDSKVYSAYVADTLFVPFGVLLLSQLRARHSAE